MHRDIKPSNIMLAAPLATGIGAGGEAGQAPRQPHSQAQVKLLDLGLARFFDDGDSSLSPRSEGEEMTGTGQAMGTADYMAPEQASDSRTVDIRADIYSLGCTLYKLLSGRAPFSGRQYASALDKMSAHVHQAVPPIRDVASAVPADLAAVLDRMLAKDPGERFAAPADVAAALEPFCRGANLTDLIARARAAEECSSGPLSRLLYSAGWERVRVRAFAARPRPPTWRRILIGLGFLGGMAAAFAAGVIITINRDGKDTKIDVPAGSNARLTPDGQLEVTLSGQAKTVEPAQRARTDSLVPKGLRVVPVAIDSINGRLVLPGSRCDIQVFMRSDPSLGISEPICKTILQDIKVFAVNDFTTEKTVSLLVTPSQAQIVTLASQLGSIRLILRSSEDSEQPKSEPVTGHDLLGMAGGGDRAKVEPIKASKMTAAESAKAASALLRSVEAARTKYDSLKATFSYDDRQCVVEMKGDLRRFEVLPSNNVARSVVLVNDSKLWDYDGKQLFKYDDMDYANGVCRGPSFDPRILGLTDALNADATVKNCLWEQSADQLELVGKEDLNGVYLAHVHAEYRGLQSDTWIEERTARVYFRTMHQENKLQIEILSTFDDKNKVPSPFPSLVRTKRVQESRIDRHRIVVSRFQVRSLIPAERFTLKSLNMPKNTQVLECSMDNHEGRLLGYWDGESISMGAAPAAKSTPPPPAPPEVTVVHPIVRQVTHHVDFPGHLEAAQTAEVRPRVAGHLAKILFQPGATVKQGDLLFEIDAGPFQAELDKREADLRLAQLRAKRATAEFKQAKELDDAKAAPAVDMPHFETQQAEAEAALTAAQEAVKVAQLNLASTRLTAPISGRIGRPLMTVGSLATDAAPLAVIDSVDPVCVAFDVPERTLLELRRNPPRLQGGSALPVLVGLSDEKGFPHKTTVESADTRVDPAKGTARWRALLPNPDGFLMPGMFVRVRLVTSDPYTVMLLPSSALFAKMLINDVTGAQVYRGDPQHSVFIMTQDNVIQGRDVHGRDMERGLREDDGMVVVEKGLNADDWIVARGLYGDDPPPGTSNFNPTELRQGMTVKPRKPPTAVPLSTKTLPTTDGKPER